MPINKTNYLKLNLSILLIIFLSASTKIAKNKSYSYRVIFKYNDKSSFDFTFYKVKYSQNSFMFG